MSTERNGSRPRFEVWIEKKYGLKKHEGERWCFRRKRCRECGHEVQGRRTKWCSDVCVNAYLIRSSPTMARRFVRQRDQGVCAQCGLDTFELKKEIDRLTREATAAWREQFLLRFPGSLRSVRWRPQHWSNELVAEGERVRKAALEPYGMSSYWKRQSFWDMDHVVAVEDGGGDCGLENLQTLCLRCHSRRSGRQRTRKVDRRRGRATFRRKVVASPGV